MKKKWIICMCVLVASVLAVKYRNEINLENIVKNQLVQDDVQIEKNEDEEKENDIEKKLDVVKSKQEESLQFMKEVNGEIEDRDNLKFLENNGSVQEKKNLKEKEIVAKYKEKFVALRSEFEGKLGGLIGQAKSEYYALPEDEKISKKVNLGLKYIKKAKSLESECDHRFNAILEKMRKELKENGCSIDIAVKARDEYKNEKNERRKALLKKALDK